MCVCNGSAPGSAKKRHAPRCVRVHVRSYVGTGVCVCECLLSSLSSRLLCECICMYMYVKTVERLQLHKAVILLLIKK